MIVPDWKPMDEILEMVRGVDNLLIVGCEDCSGKYLKGGQEQADAMSRLIEMGMEKEHDAKINTEAIAIQRQCDTDVVEKEVDPEGYEALLSLACGAGAQTLAEIYDLPVFPGCNTFFVGMKDLREDEITGEEITLEEFCSGCGDCIIHETAGVCPVTRCAKGLLNGPCGGPLEGMCEVGDYEENQCAWVEIYERLKERDELEKFMKYREPKDRTKESSPRRQMWGEPYY